MGSVRVRRDSSQLFLDFRWNGRRCREQTALRDTSANRKRLEQLLRRIEEAIAAGSFRYEEFFANTASAGGEKSGRSRNGGVTAIAEGSVPAEAGQEPAPGDTCIPGPPTFAEFAKSWVAVRRVEWRRSHLRTQLSTIDGRLVKQFGERRVDQISKADVLEFRAALAGQPGRRAGQTLSAKRINLIMTPLRQILDDAAEQYSFPSPVEKIRPLKLRRTDVQPFTLAEAQLMLATVRADYRQYLTVRMFTGMRSGEADGLKWKFVDLDRRQILIRETLVGGEVEYTKTDGSQREIAMSGPVYEALKIQEGATRKLSDFVFCNREGNPLDNKNFTDRVWYPLLRHLGLAERRPYQMRHTAATLWLAAGENPEWIARQLGHTTTEMLFKVYSRYVPNLTRQDGSAMERLLCANLPDPQQQNSEPAAANASRNERATL
jgi:integrase